MPRLIDADKVREHKYKSVQYEKAIVSELPDDPPFAFMCGWNDALDSVYQYAPTVDAEPVVRCKNCKYAKHWYGDKARCFLWSENGIDVFEDGYCNYGKRGEDAEPVRHGHWTAERLVSTGGFGGYLVKRCSVCGSDAIDAFGNKWKYCPFCGAKMDEVEDG